MSTDAPMLSHLRVLQLGSVGPGARAGRLLADFGADVVRVVPPAGRRNRGGHEVPFHTYAAGRGVRRAHIDLGDPAGRQAFLAVAATADVVLASFRPSTADRLGVGHEAVSAVNPAVVYCEISGYGDDGPYAEWAGHDIDYLAVSGLAAHGQRRSDGGPPIPGSTVADGAGGGMHAAVSVLAALSRRAVTGEGAHLHVAALDGLLWLMAIGFEEYLATGEAPAPGDGLLTGRYAWYDFYRTADDRWLAVGAIEPRFYRNLCTTMGLDHLAERQFADDQDALRAEFAETFARHDRAHWVALLGPADACVAPVNELVEALEDPQVLARLPVIDASHPDHGGFRQLGPVLAGGIVPTEAVAIPGPTHTDTSDLLSEVGYDAAEVDRLRREGVVA